MKKESLSSIEKMMADVQHLLEQDPSGVEGIQDKLRILLEEWSNRSGVEVYNNVYVCEVPTYFIL